MLGDRMDDLPPALGRKRIGCPLLAPWTCELGKWIESPDSAQVVSLRGSEHAKLDAMPRFIDSYWFHQMMAADFSRFGQVRQGRYSEIPYCLVMFRWYIVLQIRMIGPPIFLRQSGSHRCGLSILAAKAGKAGCFKISKAWAKALTDGMILTQQLHHFSEAKTPAPGKNMIVILSGLNPGGFLWISGDFLEYWTCPSRPPGMSKFTTEEWSTVQHWFHEHICAQALEGPCPIDAGDSWIPQNGNSQIQRERDDQLWDFGVLLALSATIGCGPHWHISPGKTGDSGDSSLGNDISSDLLDRMMAVLQRSK